MGQSQNQIVDQPNVMYYINTQNDDGKIMVYRNEDTRWVSVLLNLDQPDTNTERKDFG